MKIKISKDAHSKTHSIALLSSKWCIVIQIPAALSIRCWDRWIHRCGLPGIAIDYWPQHKTDGSIRSTCLIRRIEI